MDDTYVLNALDKEVHFKALGNHFTMKPRQIKRFSADIGNFIGKEKAYLGLVTIDPRFEEPEFKATEEGAALLEASRLEGVNARVRHLKMIVDNLQISLKQDLEISNIKADPLTFATDGEISAMTEMRDLQRASQDKEKLRLEQVRKLERELKANSNAIANRDRT